VNVDNCAGDPCGVKAGAIRCVDRAGGHACECSNGFAATSVFSARFATPAATFAKAGVTYDAPAKAQVALPPKTLVSAIQYKVGAGEASLVAGGFFVGTLTNATRANADPPSAVVCGRTNPPGNHTLFASGTGFGAQGLGHDARDLPTPSFAAWSANLLAGVCAAGNARCTMSSVQTAAAAGACTDTARGFCNDGGSTDFAPHLAADGVEWVRRSEIGQILIGRTKFIGGFYGASEIFLPPRKTKV
jgi:hypothetical protein